MKSRIARALAELRGQPKPQTRIASGGTKQSFFTPRGRDRELIKKYETIYFQGGYVAEAIDSYWLYILSNGWRLDGEDRDVNKVYSVLDTFDFDKIMKEGILSCGVGGDGFQEVVGTRGGDIYDIITRLPSTFDIDHDEYGMISGYTQTVVDEYGVEKKTSLRPEQIIHLQLLRLGGSVYGQSLIGRAYDDIMRDTRTAESTAVAIQRHGFRKYHVRVGREGEDIPIEVIKRIDKEFQELETKNDFVTSHDVEILGIDSGGLEQVDIYNDVTIMRVASALGVPEEMMGIRRGSTDATATKRIDVFFRKISTYQQIVARCYELNLFDRITGKPGAVRLIFNDVSPKDEAEKAAWISEMIKATPIDPFIILPRQWILEQFDIDPDAYEEDDLLMDLMPEVKDDEENQQVDETGTDTDENPAE